MQQQQQSPRSQKSVFHSFSTRWRRLYDCLEKKAIQVVIMVIFFDLPTIRSRFYGTHKHCAALRLGEKTNGHHEWRKFGNFNTFHFYYRVVVVVSGCHCRFTIISARCCTWILGIRAAFPLSGLLQFGNGADDAADDDGDDHGDRLKLLNAFNWTMKNYGNEGVGGIQRSDWHSGWYRR